MFSQEPERNNHHCSAPQISLTESTPDRNRKLLSVPGNQLQVSCQHNHSFSINVCLAILVVYKYYRFSSDGFNAMLPVLHFLLLYLKKAESPEEQQKFMNMISHGQRGRIEDQCCSLDLSKSAPCTPKHPDREPASDTGE